MKDSIKRAMADMNGPKWMYWAFVILSIVNFVLIGWQIGTHKIGVFTWILYAFAVIFWVTAFALQSMKHTNWSKILIVLSGFMQLSTLMYAQVEDEELQGHLYNFMQFFIMGAVGLGIMGAQYGTDLNEELLRNIRELPQNIRDSYDDFQEGRDARKVRKAMDRRRRRAKRRGTSYEDLPRNEDEYGPLKPDLSFGGGALGENILRALMF
jgi:hypothetical protein